MLALEASLTSWWGKGPFLLGGRGALCQGTWLGEYSAGQNWSHLPLSQEFLHNRQPYLATGLEFRATLQFGLMWYGTVVNTSQGHRNCLTIP